MPTLNRTNIHVLYTASTATTAFATDGTAPLPLTTRPTGSIGTVNGASAASPAIACEQAPAIRFTFAGVGNANTLFDYRIISWKHGSGVYLPKVVASGTATLGAMVMTAAGLDAVTAKLVDTLTDTIGLSEVSVSSPANNTLATLTVWPGGADCLTVETDLPAGSPATSASVFWEVLDEAQASRIVTVQNATGDSVNPATLEGQGGDVAAGSIGAAAVGATTSVVLAASAVRRSVTLTNLSTSVVYLAFGTAAVSGQGIPLAAAAGAGSVGGSYDVSGAMSKLAINGISDGAAKSVAYQVGSLS